MIEVIGVYLLVYLAGKVDAQTHTRITVIFGLASIMTLLIIVGIPSFMLWPGSPDRAEKGGVLTAFFIENTFSQMFTRLMFMLTITGVVGGMVAARIAVPEDKSMITRVLSTIGIIGALGGYLAFNWYMTTLPTNAHERIDRLFGCATARTGFSFACD